MSRKANPSHAKYRAAVSRVFEGLSADEVRGLSAREICGRAKQYLPNDLRSTIDPTNASVAVLISTLKRPITGGSPGRGRPRKVAVEA